MEKWITQSGAQYMYIHKSNSLYIVQNYPLSLWITLCVMEKPLAAENTESQDVVSKNIKLLDIVAGSFGGVDKVLSYPQIWQQLSTAWTNKSMNSLITPSLSV